MDENDPRVWYSSSGEIGLDINIEDARLGSHSGACDSDVRALSEEVYISRQLDKINPHTLACVLKAYGAWDIDELSDHHHNIQRLLWLACGDIVDNEKENTK